MGPATDQERRAYRSLLRRERAEQTRRQVLAAAHECFAARGYAATTMRAVARTAGVSVATLEQAFGTKASLLKATIDVAIAGDDRQVAVLDRDWTLPVLTAGSAAAVAHIVTQTLAAAQARSAGLVLSVFEGSTADDDLAELAERLTAQREVTAAWIVDRLTAHGDLRRGLTRAAAVETVWLLMDPALFVRLTRHRGWTPQHYQEWTATALVTLLFPDSPAPPSGDATNGDDPP